MFVVRAVVSESTAEADSTVKTSQETVTQAFQQELHHDICGEIQSDFASFTYSGSREGLDGSISITPLPTPHQIEIDGHFLDATGRFVGPTAQLENVTTFRPKNSPVASSPAIFVNGMDTTTEVLAQTAQHIADTTGIPIVPLYNKTSGAILDAGQSLSDKVNALENPTVSALTGIILDAFKNEKPLHLLAHSQGALVVSRALFEAMATLLVEQKIPQENVDGYFAKVTIETFGGAAAMYPPGPRYVHYVNEGDPVSFYSGLGKKGLSIEQQYEVQQKIDAPQLLKLALWISGGVGRIWGDINTVPGKDARVVQIKNESNHDWLSSHTVAEYLKNRRPPEELHSDDTFKVPENDGLIAKSILSLQMNIGGAGITRAIARIGNLVVRLNAIFSGPKE